MGVLLKALENPLMDIHWEMVGLNGELDHPDSVTAVISALDDESDLVLSASIYVLGRLGDVRAIGPLW